MKYIKPFLILILLVSCSDEKQISEFENVLGKENSQTLTYLVSDFENDFLKKNYPNLNTEQAYRNFLTKLENNVAVNWKKQSEQSRKIFDNSKLKLEIYSIPDSIWIERSPKKRTLSNTGPTIIIKRKSLKSDGTFEFSTSETSFRYPDSVNEDSIINSQKRYVAINYFGKYRNALNSVSKHHKFIEKYLYMTELAGILDPRLVAAEMLNMNVDFSDYFIKRLIVTEIAY
ncbi:hypothetical protein [Aquimarina pacifica]|uniref:hypothetical protein n=1 Tax=Aquimarina pacifica TaxID=1296415 RepID=UPI0004720078|nr:hypothetical protein [Aquimarina pacifica]